MAITDIITRKTVETTYLTCADTAKLIRGALKEYFPGVVFSVKSKTYSGGASITVSWTDGPTYDEVRRVAGAFAGASFDGMIDLKSYHTSVWNGQPVHFGADFVFCTRYITADLMRRAARYVNQRYGWTIPESDIQPRGERDCELNGECKTPAMFNNHTKGDIVWQVARTMRPNGCIVKVKIGG